MIVQEVAHMILIKRLQNYFRRIICRKSMNKTLIKNYDKIKDKELIVFTVGVADVNDAENIKNIVSSARKQIPKKCFLK